MEAGQWVPSEVVGVGAVAAVFVDAVTVVVVVVVVVDAAAGVVVAAVVAVAAAVAVAAPQSESYVGAYGLAGTGHFWVMTSADNPVSRKSTSVIYD
jgi:hypothetical protein